MISAFCIVFNYSFQLQENNIYSQFFFLADSFMIHFLWLQSQEFEVYQF